MKPAPFKYVAARSLDQALALKAEYGDDARFLAGGQSLVPALNFRLSRPDVLIDINPIADLAGVTRVPSRDLRIGALTRYRDLERDDAVRRDLPLVSEALPHIAHPQIRNRGTLGGNLSNADPASELPAVVMTLGGRLHVRSVRGERWIDAADFFVGLLTTALESDEMLLAAELPAPPPHTGFCFMEVARRRGDFALAGVAVSVTLDDDGACQEARLGFCGLGDKPQRAYEAERSLVGSGFGDEALAQAADLVKRHVDPPGSIHAGKDFQRHLAGVLASRALRTAAERARHG